MAGKIRIKDMGSNKNINIPIGVANEVFNKLGINPKESYLMDVKKAIFKLYRISNPDMTVLNPKKTLYEQRPHNAYGIKITDKEMKIFMELFGLSDNDYFQESIGGKIVESILSGQASSQKEDSNDTSKFSNVEMTEDDQSFPEGKKKLRQHLIRERNQALVLRKKGIAKKEANLSCCICEFSFEEYYGDIGKDYIEAHHVVPVSELKEDYETRLEDIVLVCSNCHRILHRKRPWLGADKLKSILKK